MTTSRLASTEHWLRSVALVVLGGAAIAVAIFLATSITPSYARLGPLCAKDVAIPGFDAWTGEPHGWVLATFDCLKVPPDEHPVVTAYVGEVPADLIGRRAVPLPIGFLAGVILGSLVVLAKGLRAGAWSPLRSVHS